MQLNNDEVLNKLEASYCAEAPEAELDPKMEARDSSSFRGAETDDSGTKS